MRDRSFHLLCEKCDARSKRFPSNSSPFLAKHIYKNCPSDALRVVYECGKRFKIYCGTVDYEQSRALELKGCLSKMRRVLKDFVNMPDWKYGQDVDNIIEETTKLKGKIAEDLKYEKSDTNTDLPL